MTWKGAATACHIGIDFAGIRVWFNGPKYGRGSFTDIFPRIVFVKGFYTVMTERGRNRRADHGFTQQCFQVVNERELGPAFYKELQHARILTGRTVKLFGKLHVLFIGFI